MPLCVHSVINTVRKDKTGRGKGTEKCQGWVTILYGLGSEGLTKQATWDKSLRERREQVQKMQVRDHGKGADTEEEACRVCLETTGGKQDGRRATGRVSHGGGIRQVQIADLF